MMYSNVRIKVKPRTFFVRVQKNDKVFGNGRFDGDCTGAVPDGVVKHLRIKMQMT